MRCKRLFWTGLALLGAATSTLRADVQSRVNVLAHALVSAPGISVNSVAVGGFSDAVSGQRPPFADTLEADLRTALARYKAPWTVLGASDSAAKADALLTGTFERSGPDIQVHAELRSQSDGTVLWQRDTVLDYADASLADLPEEGSAAEGSGVAASAGPGETIPRAGPVAEEAEGGQTVPVLPWRRGYGYDEYDYYGYHLDLSVAYKAFLPTNGSFQRTAGKLQNALSLGLDFDDVFLWDADFWDQGVSDLGTAQDLDYAGTDFALVWPFHLGHFTLYVGPGGRFGEISVYDPTALNGDYVDFGNNALEAVAGVKFRAEDVGLDLRYSGDLVSNYTGFNTLRLGAFYEFGR